MPGFNATHEIGAVQNALQNDRTSQDDIQAVGNLPIQATNYYDNDPDINAVLEQYNWQQNDDLAITTANAKALGLSNHQANVDLDGFILMSDLDEYDVNWSYDYGRTHAPNPNSLDFFSVALHEIGHILGFVSSVDSAKVADWQADSTTNHDRLDRTTTLDLFRYSDWSRRYGSIDLAAGPQTYLSVDGGNSSSGIIGHFARGQVDLGLGSDGLQTSHWNGTTSTGIMNPLLDLGERSEIANRDLRALDIIGYDLATNPTTSNTWGWRRQSVYSSPTQVNLSYSQLLVEAKQALANRLNISVSTLDAAPGVNAWLLSDTRYGDVLQMIDDSEVYARRKNRKSSSGSLWQGWGGVGNLLQELSDAGDVFDLFQQEALFSSLDSPEHDETQSLGQTLALSLQQTYGRITSANSISLTLEGSLNIDELEGSSAADWIGGLAQADQLNGGAANDFLFGNGGQDVLRGNGGDDHLVGGLGGDRLMGGHGNDYLVGGKGNDRLSGGTGIDVFMVEALDGTDIVYDFTVGEDVFALAPTLSFEQLSISNVDSDAMTSLGLESLALPNTGTHAVISHNDQALMVVLNTDAAQINADNVF